MRKIILTIIGFYQTRISPMLAPRCRFFPTCSHYAADAVNEHGALYGVWLSVVRLAKCHPFHPGGIDNVPPSKQIKTMEQSHG